MNFVQSRLLFSALLLLIAGCGKKQERTTAIAQHVSEQKNSMTSANPGSDENPMTRKKKILVFISTGGGAHTSASQAIKNYLGDGYEFKVVTMIREVLFPIDPLNWLMGGTYSGEDFYDALLKNQYIYSTHMVAKLGGMMIKLRGKTIDGLVEDFIRKEKPDLVLSVFPYFNGSLYRVTKKLNLPFLVIQPDFDSTHYAHDLANPTSEHFIFGIPFDYEGIWKKVESANIPKERVRVVGFPVRPSFFEKRDLEAARKEFNVPSDKPVAMVLMGSAGSRGTLKYAKAFAKLDYPMHVILCLGRNEALRKEIEQLQFPPHITVSLLGFTDKIADVMAISDVIITKSGPTSICEAIYARKPIIVDRTSGKILWWERLHAQFVVDNGFGEELFEIRKLPQVLGKFVNDKASIAAVKERMANYKLPDVKENIRSLVRQLIDGQDDLK